MIKAAENKDSHPKLPKTMQNAALSKCLEKNKINFHSLFNPTVAFPAFPIIYPTTFASSASNGQNKPSECRSMQATTVVTHKGTRSRDRSCRLDSSAVKLRVLVSATHSR